MKRKNDLDVDAVVGGDNDGEASGGNKLVTSWTFFYPPSFGCVSSELLR